jgi:hypothetical protein
MAKMAAPPRKVKDMPPSKAKCKIVANFLLFLDKCKIPPRWVLFNVHIDKFNGYQELFQFLVTPAQASVVKSLTSTLLWDGISSNTR